MDLYAWRKAYALADAQALARRAAESVRATPRLAALFAAARPRRPDDSGDAPRFAEVRIPPGRAAALAGPPDYTLAMLYWETARAGWAVEGVAEWLDAGEREPNPLLEAIWLRLRERDAIHLPRYDLRFSPDRVVIEAFLLEADRVAWALAAGEVIPGVPVERVTFGR